MTFGELTDEQNVKQSLDAQNLSENAPSNKQGQSENFNGTDQSKTNKTFENVRAEAKLRQDIDDFDGFNNSDDEEKIDILDEDEDTSKEIYHQNRNQMMPNIDEADELDEEMKQFQEAYEQVQQEGKQLRDDFENNAKKVIGD